MGFDISLIYIFLPIICSTVLFTGLIMYSVLVLTTMDKLYLALFGLALCGFIYVFCEVPVVVVGAVYRNFPVSVQFYRIQHIAAAFFLLVIPLFLYYFEGYSGKTGKVIQVMIAAGLFFSLAASLIAFVQPDLFVSVTASHSKSLTDPLVYGKSAKGIIYTIRDAMLGVYLIILISASIYKIIKRSGVTGYRMPVYLGLIIGSFFSLSDILSLYLDHYIDFLYFIEFQRFPAAITIFIILSMIAVFMRFVDQSVEVVKIKNQLIHRAYHDPLTNLKNRKAFFSFVKTPGKSIPEKEGVHALLLIFLTNFIEINETNGHEVGDQLLSEVTERLIRIIENKDRLFKISGSEYSALLFNTNFPTIEKVAEEVVALSKVPFTIKEEILYLEVAVGIRFFSGYLDNYQTIVRHAGYSLLKARNEKNSYSFFSQKIKKDVSRRITIISGLKNAVRNRELSMVYQPKVNYEGQVVGAEALLRWESPQLGKVSPAVFIPYAEETGLIIPIGYHIFRKVCADIVLMQEKGIKNIPIAINISPKQFRETHLMENFRSILVSFDLQLSSIHFEITETSLIEKWESIHEKLSEIFDHGIEISIDDFGTGYSSLGYLKNLPIHTVKIDRSFITGLPDNVKDGVIVGSIIKMIQGLGYSLIAEGVEEKKQLDFLYKNNCTTYQGFYFSRPLSITDFIEFVRSEKAKNLVPGPKK